jgi:hypothetical protein
MRTLIFFVFLYFCFACGDDHDKGGSGGDQRNEPDSFAFNEQETVHGQIAGQSWTAQAGYVRKVVRDGEQATYTLVLTEEDLETPCDPWSRGKQAFPRMTQFSLALSRGVHAFALQETADNEYNPGEQLYFTYYDESQRTSMTVSTAEGAYRIDEISNDQVRGVVTGRLNSNNAINGTFVAQLCG